MRPKISVGILCLDEEDYIGACLEGALGFAEEIFITDGTMNGTTVGVSDRPLTVQPSKDRTREIIESYQKKHDKITTVYLDGLPTPSEKDVRNLQLSLSNGDYFMIVDADEIWHPDTYDLLLEYVEENPQYANYAIWSRVYFKDPFTWIDSAYWRLFNLTLKDVRQFYGNNEMRNDGSCYAECTIPRSVMFDHYGYLDREKVKRKMDLYSHPVAYKGCGPKWFENVFENFTMDKKDELIKANGGTLHPWGLAMPGYAADEWNAIKRDERVLHPPAMVDYLASKGWRVRCLG